MPRPGTQHVRRVRRDRWWTAIPSRGDRIHKPQAILVRRSTAANLVSRQGAEVGPASKIEELVTDKLEEDVGASKRPVSVTPRSF